MIIFTFGKLPPPFLQEISCQKGSIVCVIDFIFTRLLKHWMNPTFDLHMTEFWGIQHNLLAQSLGD